MICRGNNGQITEREWYPVGRGESGYTIPDPMDPDVVYNAGSFMAVNDTFIALFALLDGADAEPSQDSFAAFERVCKGFSTTQASWQELRGKDLSALNTLLSQNNLAVIPNYPEIAAEASCSK